MTVNDMTENGRCTLIKFDPPISVMYELHKWERQGKW